jgi:hypothetical protein
MVLSVVGGPVDEGYTAPLVLEAELLVAPPFLISGALSRPVSLSNDGACISPQLPLLGGGLLPSAAFHVTKAPYASSRDANMGHIA